MLDVFSLPQVSLAKARLLVHPVEHGSPPLLDAPLHDDVDPPSEGATDTEEDRRDAKRKCFPQHTNLDEAASRMSNSSVARSSVSSISKSVYCPTPTIDGEGEVL